MQLLRLGASLPLAAVLLEAGLLATTAALAVLWMELPDGSTAGRVVSVASVLGWVAVFAWAQSVVFILLRGGSLAGAKAWKGALLLVGLGLLYFLVATFFDAGMLQDRERAVRWAAETWLWHVADVDTLTKFEAGGWWLLRWVTAGVLLPMGMEGAARGMQGGWLRAAGLPLRRPLYWLTLLGTAAVATAVTDAVLPVRTGLPAVLEIAVVVLAAVLVFAVDVGGLCMALAVTAMYLRKGDPVPVVADQEGQRGREDGLGTEIAGLRPTR